jgi:ribosome-dependent ATPase
MTVAEAAGVSLRYGKVIALDAISVSFPDAALTGLIGPDGVGKSSLLALIAGARQIQAGNVTVLGGDIGDSAHRNAICPRIAYMPQGLGKNLYPDLTIQENIDYFGRLFGLSRADRAARIAELLAATGLAAFAGRAARNLSGGMKQKLGLCCALIHDPDLLILDEPTTGVDPLSRRQFWDLIARIRARRPGIAVLVATAYMEEAERFDTLVAMNTGRVVATGTPAALKQQTGAATVEQAFVALMPDAGGRLAPRANPPRLDPGGAPVIIARDLTCRFGDFTAVDRVNFSILRGEIFGFLGSNGCGKTTTMKMLTGLLPQSSGEALLFGEPIIDSGRNARRRVGYMSQGFSLYTELTVRQNLQLHARLFHIPAAAARARIAALVDRFGLRPVLDQRPEDLPLGIRQRLSLAVAIVHQPELLILDEPTSGVDPLARDAFWDLLLELSRRDHVTIFVSTHFMNEAGRCDRIALMNAGRVLATGAAPELIAARHAATLEDAFISYLEEATAAVAPPPASLALPDAHAAPEAASRAARFSWRRLAACAWRETLELSRDKIRLGFALFGTTFLLLVFGFGISTDVNALSFAVLDHDNTHESRAYLEELRGSAYFVERPPIATYAELEKRLQSGEIDCAVEIPPYFGRDLVRGRPPDVSAWIDGARPFVAQTIRGYLQAMHALYLADPIVKTTRAAPADPANLQIRLSYNPNFESVYAMVPSTIAMELALFPAILMALAIVREKELGSITNLYVTPLSRLEFLTGKQIPYICLGYINFLLMLAMALVVFHVPVKGSFPVLALTVPVYLGATTAYGMMISAFARTQIAALFGTAILTVLPATMFAGMLVPVSSLTGMAYAMGRVFPMSYFLPVSLGVFTKGLGFPDLARYIGILALFVPALIAISLLLLRKQER